MATALEAPSRPLMCYTRIKLHELNMKEPALTATENPISYHRSCLAYFGQHETRAPEKRTHGNAANKLTQIVQYYYCTIVQ